VGKHERTLEAVFAKRAGIAWSDIEKMLRGLGAEISEGRGCASRSVVCVPCFTVPIRVRKPIVVRLLRCAGSSNRPGSPPRRGRMTYKGYDAVVQYDEDAGVFTGEVINTRDVIAFQGKSVTELKRAFKDSVDDYLEFCAARHEKPDKPFAGSFMVRMSPELHRHITAEARRQGKSVNAYAIEKLKAETTPARR